MSYFISPKLRNEIVGKNLMYFKIIIAIIKQFNVNYDLQQHQQQQIMVAHLDSLIYQKFKENLHK